MQDNSWSMKCIIHLCINYSFLKGLVLCFIRRTASWIFKFILLEGGNIISTGMPILKNNSSQSWKTTSINHTTKQQRKKMLFWPKVQCTLSNYELWTNIDYLFLVLNLFCPDNTWLITSHTTAKLSVFISQFLFYATSWVHNRLRTN